MSSVYNAENASTSGNSDVSGQPDICVDHFLDLILSSDSCAGPMRKTASHVEPFSTQTTDFYFSSAFANMSSPFISPCSTPPPPNSAPPATAAPQPPITPYAHMFPGNVASQSNAWDCIRPVMSSTAVHSVQHGSATTQQRDVQRPCAGLQNQPVSNAEVTGVASHVIKDDGPVDGGMDIEACAWSLDEHDLNALLEELSNEMTEEATVTHVDGTAHAAGAANNDHRVGNVNTCSSVLCGHDSVTSPLCTATWMRAMQDMNPFAQLEPSFNTASNNFMETPGSGNTQSPSSTFTAGDVLSANSSPPLHTARSSPVAACGVASDMITAAMHSYPGYGNASSSSSQPAGPGQGLLLNSISQVFNDEGIMDFMDTSHFLAHHYSAPIPYTNSTHTPTLAGNTTTCHPPDLSGNAARVTTAGADVAASGNSVAPRQRRSTSAVVGSQQHHPQAGGSDCGSPSPTTTTTTTTPTTATGSRGRGGSSRKRWGMHQLHPQQQLVDQILKGQGLQMQNVSRAARKQVDLYAQKGNALAAAVRLAAAQREQDKEKEQQQPAAGVARKKSSGLATSPSPGQMCNNTTSAAAGVQRKRSTPSTTDNSGITKRRSFSFTSASWPVLAGGTGSGNASNGSAGTSHAAGDSLSPAKTPSTSRGIVSGILQECQVISSKGRDPSDLNAAAAVGVTAGCMLQGSPSLSNTSFMSLLGVATDVKHA